MSLLYIKCIFIHQGSVFSSFFLAFFKFSAFFSLFSSVRGIIRETSSFSFFLNFFLFSGGFSLIFLFYRPGCTFSAFYRFIWFHYNFSVFMVLIFFSRCHVFYPLFHLSGLPFSFFCKQSHFFSFINIFYSFSPFFIPHRHFTPFSCLSLPLPPVFILFAHVYTTFSPFQSFFAFSQLIFIFFAFSASSIVLHPLFAIFLDHPSFFRFYLCHFPRLIFHVSRLSKCFTWNIVFYDFRSSAISEQRFASRLSENHSHFSPLLFLK